MPRSRPWRTSQKTTWPHGEIDTAHPGSLGSQDTFYVGTIEGVGRIYPPTFVDTYRQVAMAKRSTTKTPITGADRLNDRGLPLLCRTRHGDDPHPDRPEHRVWRPARAHDYQLYLALNDLEHTQAQARHPQTSGLCERFHKTILQEFYQLAFRKKLYLALQELQADLEAWIRYHTSYHTSYYNSYYTSYYSSERTQQGKMCCGRTPLQTLLAAQEAGKEKVLNLN